MGIFAETAGMDINEFRRIIETDIGSADTDIYQALTR